MKQIIVALFAASSLLVAAPLPALAGTDVAAVCDGAVPEGWQRPGGFCDQNDFNHSLTDPSNSQSCDPAVIVGMNASDEELRMLVAGSPVSCCTIQNSYKINPSTGRVIVADYSCCDVGMKIDPELNNNALDQRDRMVLVSCR